MRILKLMPRIEKWLLSRRARRDEEAHSVASKIVADVRKRGDAALFAWTKKLDNLDLARDGVWISQKEIRSAERRVSSEFLGAIKRATKNVRIVAEKQIPRPWTFETEPGVRISQRVSPIESIGCYIPGGHFSSASGRSPESAAHKQSLPSHMAQSRFPASRKSSARATSTSRRPNNS